MKTYHCNCILTFNSGPQSFLDLLVPLDAGEDVCRVLFEAVAETLRPTLSVTLSSGDPELDKRIPKRPVLTIDEAKAHKLAKVSMWTCSDSDLPPTWYTVAHGSLYWH